MTPETETELQRTLGRLLEASDSAKSSIDALTDTIGEVRDTVNKMSTLPERLSKVESEISVLKSARDRSIGKKSLAATVFSGLIAIAAVVVAWIKGH